MKNPPRSFDFRTSRGVEDIKVELWDAQLPKDAARVISSFYMSTWGDPINPSEWTDDHAWSIAQDACDGKVLPNTLEAIALTFSMNGISRATTHQMVRTRVGAVFGQQGGRDNNWSDFNLRIPETWWRDTKLAMMAEDLQIFADKVYKAALAAGVPFQDARYVLPMGLETALVGSYNLLSLKSLADRRLCNRMMWETNYVVRMMSDLAVLQYPFLGRNLRSSCEKRGVCGSVSPMFPPACLTYGMNKDGVKGVTLARDNPTLMATTAEVSYDFPQEANGCYLHFNEIDTQRLETERLSPDVVVSLLDGKTVLAFKDSKGLWRNDSE